MKTTRTKPARKSKSMKVGSNRTSQNSSLRKQAPKKSVNSKKTEKTKSDAAKTLQDLFVDELKDIYWAEKALTKAIPKMIKKATAPQLAEALSNHLEETQEQVTRLEKVFAAISKKPEAKKCEAMEGLIKEANEIIQSTKSGSVRDAGIISAGQKVEHYEIATYGTLLAFAKLLGQKQAVSLLETTLNEEKAADEKLSEIAESSINAKASSKQGGYEEEEEEETEETEDEETEQEEEYEEEEN
jgi:ferritin-like metal-binding protein YciE